MKLVGSPLAFIRGPFIAEGLLQGGFGAVVALILLWLGFKAVASGGARPGGHPRWRVASVLPIREAILLVAGGMFVGAAGVCRFASRDVIFGQPALTVP